MGYLDIHGAYTMISQFPGRVRLLNVVETDHVWAFRFSEGAAEIVGGCYDAVDKQSGAVHRISIPYGLAELKGGKQLDIRQFQK